MLDLTTETPITFAQAARLVPGGVHRATVASWAEKGIRNGIKLEYEIIAGRKKTTPEALGRFLDACRQRGWAGIANGHMYERVMAAKEQQEHGHQAAVENDRPGAAARIEVALGSNKPKAASKNLSPRRKLKRRTSNP
jgi:hypothetical protein